jgi:hypothetical protein
MSSDVLEDTSPEDTSSEERAMLQLDSPKKSGRGKTDKKEGALVIPAKKTVKEKPVIDIKASIQRGAALNKPKIGKYREPPDTAKRKMANPDVKPKKTQKSTKIPEDCLQLKNPPEGEMLVPMKPCLDNPVGILSLLQRQNTKVQSPPLLPQHQKIILS